MGKEDEQKSEQEQQPEKTPCNKEQYELLMRCSAKKDMTEWNKWREEHPDEEIYLENANLKHAHLENANLVEAHLENANLVEARLENANLVEAHLENAYLVGAHLKNAHLGFAHLKNANLNSAHMENVNLARANLKNAHLLSANLECAFLAAAHMENVNLQRANLENAILVEAHLQDTLFEIAKLQGADFSGAVVNGGTLICDSCEVDQDTMFEAVALGNMRIYPNIKQLLEYNVRRKNWEKWYRGKSKNKLVIKMHQLLTCPVRLFWWISNYGLSTWRIILTFLALSVIFATIYFVWGALDYYHFGVKEQPGIVNDLFVSIAAKEEMSELYYSGMVYFRSIYFSIVTMTTLGFGDMYANATHLGYRWWFGHLLLMLQVILGYILLGAMVTRFAVLFTAGGPAGQFSKKTSQKTTTWW